MNIPSSLPGISKNILLVDDDDDIRALLGYQLQRAGYAVTPVSDGFRALQALKKQPFDLIITDALMPEMTGYELAQAVRDTEVGARLPVMMLTALDNEQDILTLSRSGVDHLECKPFIMGSLLTNVARLLTGKP